MCLGFGTASYVVVFIFNLANRAHAIGNMAAGIKNRNEELMTVVRFTDKVNAIAIHIIHISDAIVIFFQSCFDIEEICEKYLYPKAESIRSAEIILKVVNVSTGIS